MALLIVPSFFYFLESEKNSDFESEKKEEDSVVSNKVKSVALAKQEEELAYEGKTESFTYLKTSENSIESKIISLLEENEGNNFINREGLYSLIEAYFKDEKIDESSKIYFLIEKIKKVSNPLLAEVLLEGMLKNSSDFDFYIFSDFFSDDIFLFKRNLIVQALISCNIKNSDSLNSLLEVIIKNIESGDYISYSEIIKLYEINNGASNLDYFIEVAIDQMDINKGNVDSIFNYLISSNVRNPEKYISSIIEKGGDLSLIDEQILFDLTNNNITNSEMETYFKEYIFEMDNGFSTENIDKYQKWVSTVANIEANEAKEVILSNLEDNTYMVSYMILQIEDVDKITEIGLREDIVEYIIEKFNQEKNYDRYSVYKESLLRLGVKPPFHYLDNESEFHLEMIKKGMVYN